MGAGAYVAGVAFFSFAIGCAGLATALVLRTLGHLSGAARVLAVAILFTFFLLAEHLVPGVLGVLSRGSVVAASALVLVCAWAATRRHATSDYAGLHAPPAPAESALTRVLAGLAAAAFTIFLAGYFRTEATHALAGDDMLNFHLPLIAKWVQGGSFWRIVDLLPYDTTGNYPQNGDVVTLAAVLPWRGDAFARFAVLPYVAMTGLGTYALAREVAAPRARAALFGLLVMALPILLGAGVTSALPDALMYGTFAAGLVFLSRAARSRLRSDAVLAGLALGIAFGTKWYAVPAAIAMLVLWGAALVVRRWPLAEVARRLALAVGAVAVAGGFWLVRNAIESGSPFFPAGWLPLGARADLVRPGPRVDFPIAHYLLDLAVWRHTILPDELRAFGLGGVLLVVGTIAGGAVAVRMARSRDRTARVVLWAVAAVLMLTAVYAITPNTATGPDGHPVLVYYSARYLVPAAVPAAAVCAWLAARIGRLGPVVDLVALAGVVDGLSRTFNLSGGQLAAGVLALVLLIGLAWLARALMRLPARARVRRVSVALGVVAAVTVAGGFELARRYGGGRLRGLDASVDRFLAESRPGDRVAVAESWSVTPPSPVYPMFGADLRNRVDYAGEWRSGVNRPQRDRARFDAALRSGGYRWLMIGRGEHPPAVTPAMRWARDAGFAPVAQSQRLALYRRVDGGGKR